VTSQSRILRVRHLGLVPYQDALALQARVLEERQLGTIEDTLFVLQHPPVITSGRGAKVEHVLWSPQRLQEEGFDLFDTGRGGDVTYHGPGQVVVYPIIDLKPDRCDVRKYVAALEETMLQTLAEFGIEGRRVEGQRGVWVAEQKIGAVGVRISRWVTMHGFALNVTTDLNHFQAIVPCGIQGCEVTSMQNLLGVPVDVSHVETSLVNHLASWLNATPIVS